MNQTQPAQFVGKVVAGTLIAAATLLTASYLYLHGGAQFDAATATTIKTVTSLADSPEAVAQQRAELKRREAVCQSDQRNAFLCWIWRL